jgi:hypothetical protein
LRLRWGWSAALVRTMTPQPSGSCSRSSRSRMTVLVLLVLDLAGHPAHVVEGHQDQVAAGDAEVGGDQGPLVADASGPPGRGPVGRARESVDRGACRHPRPCGGRRRGPRRRPAAGRGLSAPKSTKAASRDGATLGDHAAVDVAAAQAGGRPPRPGSSPGWSRPTMAMRTSSARWALMSMRRVTKTSLRSCVGRAQGVRRRRGTSARFLGSSAEDSGPRWGGRELRGTAHQSSRKARIVQHDRAEKGESAAGIVGLPTRLGRLLPAEGSRSRRRHLWFAPRGTRPTWRFPRQWAAGGTGRGGARRTDGRRPERRWSLV